MYSKTNPYSPLPVPSDLASWRSRQPSSPNWKLRELGLVGVKIEHREIVLLPAQARRQSGADMDLQNLRTVLARQEGLGPPTVQVT